MNAMFSHNVNSLQWRHNECDGAWYHQPHECLLSRWFKHRSKKTSKLRVTGLCVRGIPVTGKCFHSMTTSCANKSCPLTQPRQSNVTPHTNIVSALFIRCLRCLRCHIKPCVEIIFKNVKTYLYFLWFLNNQMKRVIEILSPGRQAHRMVNVKLTNIWLNAEKVTSHLNQWWSCFHSVDNTVILVWQIIYVILWYTNGIILTEFQNDNCPCNPWRKFRPDYLSVSELQKSKIQDNLTEINNKTFSYLTWITWWISYYVIVYWWDIDYKLIWSGHEVHS